MRVELRPLGAHRLNQSKATTRTARPLGCELTREGAMEAGGGSEGSERPAASIQNNYLKQSGCHRPRSARAFRRTLANLRGGGDPKSLLPRREGRTTRKGLNPAAKGLIASGLS
jgi:hypothetical protein